MREKGVCGIGIQPYKYSLAKWSGRISLCTDLKATAAPYRDAYRWYSNTWANFSEGRVNITENLLLSPPCFALLITGGELEQIFGNIHPTFAKISSGIWISPIYITVWSRCRFQIGMLGLRYSPSHKRVFRSLTTSPAHALSLYTCSYLVPIISYIYLRLHALFPASFT